MRLIGQEVLPADVVATILDPEVFGDFIPTQDLSSMGELPARWFVAAGMRDLAGVVLWVPIIHNYTSASRDVKDAARSQLDGSLSAFQFETTLTCAKA